MNREIIDDSFSPEYDTGAKTQSKEEEKKYKDLDIEHQKYGVGKPTRTIIRAKLIHD